MSLRLHKWKSGNWAEQQAALELPAKPYLISCLERLGKYAEREASGPYKGKPNLVTGDWNRFWNAAHNGRAALWSQTFFCVCCFSLDWRFTLQEPPSVQLVFRGWRWSER